MKHFLVLLLAGLALTAACNAQPAPSHPAFPSKTPDAVEETFVPAPVPTLSAEAEGQQPLYFFLFTHTEDPFNHDLSEERYLRLVPEVEARAASHPEAGLVWTIMFQGTDARAVAERNPQTGVLDLLRQAHEAGVVEFGYHGHHEATYDNRPQTAFSESSSWETLTAGMLDWAGCQKDVLYGGCIGDRGGIYNLLDNFGPVEVVSGVFMVSDVAYEGGPATHAVANILPDRLLSFGYPDHGPFAAGTKREAVAALMARLTPTNETSASVFWADNVIKMTGGNPIDGTRGIDPLRGPQYAAQMLAGLDRSHPNLILTGLGSKFLYTRQGQNTSPTIYGYAHPESPELPESLLNTPRQREVFYQQSLQTLDYLLDEVLPQNPGARFVNSQEVVDMVAPPAYWQITPSQLDVLSRWALIYWTDRPPDWVSDGTDFYSLRDLFTLLVRALAEETPSAAGQTLALGAAYGPLEAVDAAGPVVLTREEILQTAAALAPDFSPDAAWQLTPSAMVQPVYRLNGQEVTAAQLLYGLATVYAADYAGVRLERITLPATRAMPVTYDLLQDIGCLATCSGTAWSFKPARLVQP